MASDKASTSHDAGSLRPTSFYFTSGRAFDHTPPYIPLIHFGTLMRANASFKSFVPIEVAMDPEEYKKRLRSSDNTEEEGPQDPGNPKVDFREEKRSNKTHRSTTDPDYRFVSKGSSGSGAYPGYTVNAFMENRNRILLGMGVEIFRSSASEEQGALDLLSRAKRRHKYTACRGYAVCIVYSKKHG